MIKNEVITFSREEADDLVWKYFIRKSNIKDEKKLKRMEALAQEAHQLVKEKVNMRAVVSASDKFYVADDKLFVDEIGEVTLKTSKINLEHVSKIYSFILCAGEFEIEVDPINDIFADLWGTAYVDAQMELLRKELIKREQKAVSLPFGPGFYGMELGDLNTIFDSLDNSKIDVELRGSLMVPLKSCAGFFLVSDMEFEMPERDCMNCVGNINGCSYCRNFKRD